MYQLTHLVNQVSSIFPSNNMDLVWIVTLVLIISATLRLVARPLFHPPSPRLPPSPTAWPIIGHLHLLGPLLHQTFRDMATRLGPVILVRLGSVPVAVVSTPELAMEALKTHETSFLARPANKAITKLTNGSALAFSPSGPYWKFTRKLLMTELLGHRTISHFLPVRTQEYGSFLRLLAKRSEAGEAVNLTEELMKLTNNVISQMMFGFRSSGTDGEAEVIRTVVREVTRMFGEFNVSEFLWFCKINVDFEKKIDEIHRRYDALLEKIIGDREAVRLKRKGDVKEDREEEVYARNFLDMLLDIVEDPNAEIKITKRHIKGLILDFFTAATDTTSIITEWSLAELMNHPNVLAKAREEIDKVIGKDRLISESDIPNLPYINAIMKESFRLHPPIPLINRKSVKDCHIGGYFIPADTMFFINIWSIGRDPKYWDDPLDFKPERFLAESDKVIDLKGQHFQLLPFGSGRRSCPGMSLATREVPVMLANMIHCFDWKLAGLDGAMMNGDDVVVDMSERSGLTTPRARDLICFPVKRFSPLPSIQ